MLLEGKVCRQTQCHTCKDSYYKANYYSYFYTERMTLSMMLYKLYRTIFLINQIQPPQSYWRGDVINMDTKGCVEKGKQTLMKAAGALTA